MVNRVHGVRRMARTGKQRSHLQTIREEEVWEESYSVAEPLVMGDFSVPSEYTVSWWGRVFSPRIWCYECIDWGSYADLDPYSY